MRSDRPRGALVAGADTIVAMIVVPGTIIANRYRVVRPIAEGGMGAVFEVEQAATGARRALKVMHGHISQDDRQRTRFVQEARVGATIASDHVAKVLDAGVDDATGMLFIVMDLLEGHTLGDEIRRRGTLSLRETHDVLRQVCHALQAAHRMGIIHRDLKPSNVLLSPPQIVGMDAMVRILDFGIAKLAAEANAGATAIVGTPSWMAPEQTDPRGTVSPATDIWPLGLITFKMLTGYHYFPSGNDEKAGTASMLRESVLDPLVLASQRAASYGVADRLPPGFDSWFARCVVREQGERLGSAHDAYTAFASLAAPYLGMPATPHFAAPGSSQPSMSALDRPTAVEASNPWQSSSGGSQPGAVYAGPTTTSPRPASTSAGAWIAIAMGALVLVGAASAAGWFLLHKHQAQAATAPASSVSAGAASSTPSPAATDGAVVLARLHGSNTIGEELAPALVEAFLKRHAGVATVTLTRTGEDAVRIEARPSEGPPQVVELEARGSGTAFTDLAAGKADVAMSSRRIDADEARSLVTAGDMTSAACENVLGLDGVAIIESSSNPVSGVGTATLAKILTGDITSWRDVGGRDAPIAVYARDERSGTLDLLKSVVLGGRAITTTARRFESSEKLSAAVAADADGIGFVGIGAVRSAKPLMLEGVGARPLVPSPATIANEDYLLTRRLYLYTPSKASDDVRAFIEFALSDDGQKIVSHVGFVDLRPTCEPPTESCEHCPKDYVAAVAHSCRVSATLRFDTAGGQLDTRALRDLQRLASMLRRPEYATRGVILAAFASGATRDEAVQRSTADAEAVAVQLRARGIHVVSVKGHGANPIADDATEAGRERSRRVEVWLR